MNKETVMKKIFDWTSLAPYITFVIIFIAWDGAVYLFNIPDSILPPLSSILYTLVSTFIPVLGHHMLVTLSTILTGMIIGAPLGILIASLVSQMKIVEAILKPYIIILVTLPMVVLLPILMMWFGFGSTATNLVVICQTAPIVALNSITGFNSVERSKVQLGESMGANRLQIFGKIVFPNALPYVFTGLRLGGIFATTATISAELVSSTEGLGNRVIYFSKMVQMESAWACILLIAVIGVTLFGILTFIENKIVVWKER
ncbi:MAG: ABC transporter permease [Christensenella sp.]|uniref:ABC transporter permease n=1 Tax=Christensenella sp. TaxID=1935934 RepID=UPI002B1EE594|nr:ABC transporter permease [Christensenella sp.]MEA5003475.1 ABC transporter permease [Christensenella sp.]